MDTRILRCIGRGLGAAGLSLLVALTGCSNPGTDVEAEKKKDADALASYADLNLITDAGEKTVAMAFKNAGADVFVTAGTVTDILFSAAGCDDVMAATLSQTPNVERLTLGGSSKVTDKSVPAISSLKNLKMADLQGTSISNAGAKKIQAAAGKGAMVMHPAIQMMQGPGGGPGGPGGPGG